MKPMVAVRRSVRCLSSAVLTAQCADCPPARHFFMLKCLPRTWARKTHDAAMASNPRGAFVGEMYAAGIGKFQRSCAAGGGTLSGQFSLRILGQAFSTSPFLFFGSAKPFLLFRREREEMVSTVLRRPQAAKLPCRRTARNPRRRRRHPPSRARGGPQKPENARFLACLSPADIV